MRAVSLWFVFAVLVAGCDRGGVGTVQTGFRAGTGRLEFGKALVGEKVVRELELVATGRGSITVELQATPPFEAPPSVTLPGAGSVRVPITWTVGAGVVESVLTATAQDASIEVILTGRGVTPLDCQPSARCREVRFDLETERCIESVSDNGTTCTPENQCLENGVCRGGTCVGTARSCDDGNACTQDACSPEVGCVHVDISSSCPRPVNPCEVATCDPVGGCGSAVLGDGSLCGAADCVTANMCQGGTCKPFPTPEGFLCAPGTPCQGEGHCSGGSCVRPDAGTLKPEWSLPIAAVSGRTRMGVEAGNIFFVGCGPDAEDGGCALRSFTSNGFLRFEAALDVGSVLAGISGGTVAVAHPEALHAFLATSGAPLWSVPLDALTAPTDGGVPWFDPRAVALDSAGGVFAAVGWVDTPYSTLVHVAPGGAVDRELLISDAGMPALASLSASGAVYLYDPAGPLTCIQEADGGTGYLSLGDHPGAAALSVVGDRIVPGGEVLLDSDGGVVANLLSEDAGETPLDMEILLGADLGYVFFESGDGGDLHVRAFAPATGKAAWESVVLPGAARGEVIDVHQVGGGGFPSGVLTFTEASVDGGVRSDVQLFANGKRAMLCPVDGTPRVGGGVFAPGRLYAIVERGGEWRLEAFDLRGVPFTQGARRER